MYTVHYFADEWFFLTVTKLNVFVGLVVAN